MEAFLLPRYSHSLAPGLRWGCQYLERRLLMSPITSRAPSAAAANELNASRIVIYGWRSFSCSLSLSLLGLAPRTDPGLVKINQFTPISPKKPEIN